MSLSEAYERFPMIANGGHLYFDQMVELFFFRMTFHINESYMGKKLSFLEVANIAGFHINMDTMKEKFTNIHMQDRSILRFRSCV